VLELSQFLNLHIKILPMDATVPATRRSRKSTGAFGRETVDKENATFDVGSNSLAGNKKKSRSKSIGPGGLDGLKQGHGNRRAVCTQAHHFLSGIH
jgi:hypothetical protein